MQSSKIPFGPTYEEMLHPEKINPGVREKASMAAKENELDPINLFNITWKDEAGRVREIILPRELTGVDANIVVMLGTYFPSGSHKVGPAYATLIEGCVDGEIIPGQAHHSGTFHRELWHRCGLYLPSDGLQGRRHHARQHEQGTV